MDTPLGFYRLVCIAEYDACVSRELTGQKEDLCSIA